MARKKYSLFKRGDVIRTNPQDGFYGIAVVLDDGVKLELSPNKWSYPMCHIAITPLIYDYEVTISDIDLLFRFELLLGFKIVMTGGDANTFGYTFPKLRRCNDFGVTAVAENKSLKLVVYNHLERELY